MFSNATRLLHKKNTFIILFAGTITLMFIMGISGRPLNTKQTPFGILHLELAGTKQNLQEVLIAWKNTSTLNNDIIKAAKTNTLFDFIFLIFYSFFLFCSCRKLSALVRNNKMSAFLSYLSGVALLAGALDFLENVGMLLSLSGIITQGITLFTSVVSFTKWVLVLIVIASLILGIVFVFMQQKRSQRWCKLSQPLHGNIQEKESE